MKKLTNLEKKQYEGGVNCTIWAARCAAYIAAGSRGCVDQCAVFTALCR